MNEENATENVLTLLIRVMCPADRLSLLREVYKIGTEKAVDNRLAQFMQDFPSVFGAQPIQKDTREYDEDEDEELEEEVEETAYDRVGALLASWDYIMPNGDEEIVNLFQEGIYLHINSDKLLPIRKWVVKRLYEDGTILVNVPRKKDKFFYKKYYKLYQIINVEGQRFPICYS